MKGVENPQIHQQNGVPRDTVHVSGVGGRERDVDRTGYMCSLQSRL